MTSSPSQLATTWKFANTTSEPSRFRAYWHPRTLLAWVEALAVTGTILPRLGKAEDPAHVLSHWSRNLLRALHVEVEFTSAIPTGGQLWVSNHLSWLDPAVLLAQRPMGTLAKAEVASYPWLGRHARRAGLQFVDRNKPLHRALALLELVHQWRTGAPFLLFPEGTTTNGRELAPLYEGGLRAAFRLGLTVLPLRLESPDAHYPWIGAASLAPHIQALCRARRTQVKVHPGPVMAAIGDEDVWLLAIRTHLNPHSK